MERKMKLVRKVGKCVNKECENFGSFVRVGKVYGRICGRCGSKRKVFVMIEREKDIMQEFVDKCNTEWSKEDLDENGMLKQRI